MGSIISTVRFPCLSAEYWSAGLDSWELPKRIGKRPLYAEDEKSLRRRWAALGGDAAGLMSKRAEGLSSVAMRQDE